MSEMDHGHSKKVVNCDGGANGGAVHDSTYYPSPYAMTQFSANGGGGQDPQQCGLHLMEAMHHTSPMKAVIINILCYASTLLSNDGI